jgi:hypothetical protein
MNRNGGRINLLDRQVAARDCSRDGVFRDTFTRLRPMLAAASTVSQLSNVITQATAPAFLLAALLAFVALLIARSNRIIVRSIFVNAISDNGTVRARLKENVPRLQKRAAMIDRAILWAIGSSNKSMSEVPG